MFYGTRQPRAGQRGRGSLIPSGRGFGGVSQSVCVLLSGGGGVWESTSGSIGVPVPDASILRTGEEVVGMGPVKLHLPHYKRVVKGVWLTHPMMMYANYVRADRSNFISHTALSPILLYLPYCFISHTALSPILQGGSQGVVNTK